MVYVLLLWPLRTTTTLMQGNVVVSENILCFERKPCGLHVRPGFTRSHFSLSEEARNTELHSWSSDLKLRHSRVAFISAGTSTTEDLNPLIQKSKNRAEAIESSFQEKSRASAKASENQSTTNATAPDGQMSRMTLTEVESAASLQAKLEDGLHSVSRRSNVGRGFENSAASNEIFSTDLKGADDPMYPSLAPPTTRRSPSPTGSDSSGEVIVFAGRRHSCNKRDQKYTSDEQSRDLNRQGNQYVSKPSERRNFMVNVVDDPIHLKTERIKSPPQHRSTSFLLSDPERAPGHFNSRIRATATKCGLRRRGRHQRKEEEDGILDDYVENLRNGGNLEALVMSPVLNQRDLGGSDTAEWQNEVESLATGRVEGDPLASSEEWDSADLEDFDEISTSNEALDSIEQILSKRERPSGVQYLVTGAGHLVDDARWLPISSLNIPGAEALIQEFEDEADLNPLLNRGDVSNASLSIDQQVEQDLQEDLDDQEDEKDIEDRRKARMTDEQIARLLSKQEELGLGSNDLMLLDGGDVETDSEKELQLDGLWERVLTHEAPSRSKRAKRFQSSFPSATAFIDALDQDPYSGFDVMDQERPSLRKRPKDRRGKFAMELSDLELEQSKQTAWEKDRSKKKMRKQEREELRAQGLLGTKNKINLKAKYPEGMSMAEVKNEIREFLLSSMERYVLAALLPLLPIINPDCDTVCRFHRWLRASAKWCMRLPTSSN